MFSPPVIWEWSHIYYMAGGAAGQERTGGMEIKTRRISGNGFRIFSPKIRRYTLKAETGQQSPRQRPDGDRRSDDGKPKDSVGIP